MLCCGRAFWLLSGDNICLVGDSPPDGSRDPTGASAEHCTALQSSHPVFAATFQSHLR